MVTKKKITWKQTSLHLKFVKKTELYSTANQQRTYFKVFSTSTAPTCIACKYRCCECWHESGLQAAKSASAEGAEPKEHTKLELKTMVKTTCETYAPEVINRLHNLWNICTRCHNLRWAREVSWTHFFAVNPLAKNYVIQFHPCNFLSRGLL
jgi:hypothetical protein